VKSKTNPHIIDWFVTCPRGTGKRKGGRKKGREKEKENMKRSARFNTDRLTGRFCVIDPRNRTLPGKKKKKKEREGKKKIPE